MKTRYIIALALGAVALVGCQREELAEPGVLSGKEGVVKFAPSVGGILSAVKSGYTADAPAATGTQSSLTLTSEDGGFTLPMDLSVTSLEIGDGTKATLINENGGISGTDFATAIGNIFWVAAWDKPASGDPAHIIPDKTISGYTTTDGKYQKVMYRTKDVAGNDLTTPYWMTMQPMPSTITVVSIDQPADDEYIWKKIVPENGHAETKTFYAYANVPTSATMALLAKASGQTMTLSAIPDKDVLMGYYQGEGKTGPEDAATHTGTASIQFHHPFAAVKVKTGTIASGVTIKSVAIEKVYGKGGEGDDGKLKVKHVVDEFTWTRADGDSFTDENLVESIDVTCDGAAELVLPQTFPSKARIHVTLQQDGKSFNVYSPLSGTWAPGTLYTYTIGYDPLPDELLTGKFSVSATDYVQFSRGNLYCTRSGEEEPYEYAFAFEQNQYDYRCRSGINGDHAYIGGTVTTTTPSTSGLFQWIPRTSSFAADDWGAFSEYFNNPSDDKTSDMLDFGGVFPASGWTTLTNNEWQYLLDNHKNKIVTVNGVKGLCIAPDDYSGTISDQYSSETTPTWAEAETAGMVFLPYYGYYNPNGGNNEIYTHEAGYWSSTPNSTGGDNARHWAQALKFGNSGNTFGMEGRWRIYGQNVRLVQRFEKPVPVFSVSNESEAPYDDVKKVLFAPGNLYWSGTDFKFEANQYDYRGYNGCEGDQAVINGKKGKTPSGTCGLFYWFNYTNRQNSYAESYTAAENPSEKDIFFTNNMKNERIAHSSITVNGETGIWRTLTANEWNYLINVREVNGKTGYGNTCAWATVNSVKGVIIFYDKYKGPTTNLTSIPEGCAFLPAAGFRGVTIGEGGDKGYYSSSTAYGSDKYYHIYFTDSSAHSQYNDRKLGRSVRLVKDL